MLLKSGERCCTTTNAMPLSDGILSKTEADRLIQLCWDTGKLKDVGEVARASVPARKAAKKKCSGDVTPAQVKKLLERLRETSNSENLPGMRTAVKKAGCAAKKNPRLAAEVARVLAGAERVLVLSLAASGPKP